ncbi:MAG: thymidine phosphorylase [Deltaproteobacteria bacterium]|nr:thymidine phosphorylase [Deltaproteobacteria bacterium]
MFVPDVIRRKRDGNPLSGEEIREVIRSFTSGALPDYQMSALLMAVFFRGLDEREQGEWTQAMLASGDVVDLAGVPGVKVDKHSTGGVGDKISICLAPAVACLGVPVPMISGRGLGHTGGTLDKLEAIPGFRVDLDPGRFRDQVRDLGLALCGQTASLAPADRLLYALRDVTATVESIPLIASSIMSKKLAEGIDALVLDVKVGAGAFMRDLADARRLAATLVAIGEGAGRRVRALVTDMEEPIGRAVGNALEVAEAIEIMRGRGPRDATELTVELGAEMLVLGGAATDLDGGRMAMRQALGDGRALDLFARVVEAQGGDPRVCEDAAHLPAAGEIEAVRAARGGYVTEVRPRDVAMAALEVGAGRRVKEARVDPATGVIVRVKTGDEVRAGDALCELHHNGSGRDEALARLRDAFGISDEPPAPRPLVVERL